jgi:hypothetical protein
MTDTVKILVDALEDCIDDSKQVLSDMIQTYGENYKQERIAAQRETIAKAEAALSAAKGGGWLPIESAPKDGTEILIFRDYAAVKVGGGYWSIHQRCWIHGGYMCWQLPPTHWQPLPTPPNTSKGLT